MEAEEGEFRYGDCRGETGDADHRSDSQLHVGDQPVEEKSKEPLDNQPSLAQSLRLDTNAAHGEEEAAHGELGNSEDFSGTCDQNTVEDIIQKSQGSGPSHMDFNSGGPRKSSFKHGGPTQTFEEHA
ncbi:hypothetical protein Hanom_Chr10g00884881 [Helianthus anomalus]